MVQTSEEQILMDGCWLMNNRMFENAIREQEIEVR